MKRIAAIIVLGLILALTNCARKKASQSGEHSKFFIGG